MGEQLLCEREPGNVVDRYGMAVKKDSGSVTVGHLPVQYVHSTCTRHKNITRPTNNRVYKNNANFNIANCA